MNRKEKTDALLEKHIVANKIKSGVKFVTVPSEYFKTLGLQEE